MKNNASFLKQRAVDALIAASVTDDTIVEGVPSTGSKFPADGAKRISTHAMEQLRLRVRYKGEIEKTFTIAYPRHWSDS